MTKMNEGCTPSHVVRSLGGEHAKHYLHDDPEDDDETLEDVVGVLPTTLLVPTISAVVLGVVWMFLLYKFPLPMVYGTLILKGVIILGFGGWVYAVSDGNFGGIVMVGLGLLYFLLLWFWRNRIQLTAKLIQQAVVVSAVNPGIFAASGLLLVLKILTIMLSFAAYVLIAMGPVNPKPAVPPAEPGCAFEEYILCLLYTSPSPRDS